MKTVHGIMAIGMMALSGWMLAGCAAEEPQYLDLTHDIPTFQPVGENLGEPDLSRPNGDSRQVPSFFPQAVFQPSTNPTNQGHFYRGRLAIAEHHGTHVDAPSHYVNSPETREASAVALEFQDDLTLDDLIGPIVYIDISERVNRELAKNNGQPSPDMWVTDFSESSLNNVTAADIDAVAGRLRNGSWIVVNTGWSRFFFDADFATSPYINGWNFPGISRAAIDRLIEIEEERGIRINGVVTDNIGIDSGEVERGEGDSWSNSFHSHVRGLQRGWKFVENAANLGSLASVDVDNCTLIVGALPIVHGSGSPARVIAACSN